MVRLATTAMRTRFEIVLADPDSNEADLRAAGEEALEEIHRVESWLSVYREDAVLYRLNLQTPGHPLRVSAPVFAFLQTAYDLSVRTGGAFDLTVGPLVQLWRKAGEADRIPTPADIAEQLSLVGIEQGMRLDPQELTVCLTRKNSRLDPGAIGKGYALDRAADILREAGIGSALLHGGTSSIVAMGTPPGSTDGWPIAIQHPQNAGSHLAVIILRDQALGVSAVHGRSFYAEGRTFGHVMDPRTGYPVEKTVLATCSAISATQADALSTALLVLGAEGLSDLKARFPDAGLLVAEVDTRTQLLQVTAGDDSWQLP